MFEISLHRPLYFIYLTIVRFAHISDGAAWPAGTRLGAWECLRFSGQLAIDTKFNATYISNVMRRYLHLRKLILFLCALMIGIPVSTAEPTDISCTSGEDTGGFQINLRTTGGNAWANGLGVEPLQLGQSAIGDSLPFHTKGEALFRNGELAVVRVGSENIVGQWLIGSRIDLHIYREVKGQSGKINSIDLKFTSKWTGEMDKVENTYAVFRGTYLLKVSKGSLKKGAKVYKQYSGKVICS